MFSKNDVRTICGQNGIAGKLSKIIPHAA